MLKAVIAGANALAIKIYMFGLDHLQLVEQKWRTHSRVCRVPDIEFLGSKKSLKDSPEEGKELANESVA